ncbi:hypothetical protein PHMEG_00041974 [Phytophthora megakarya]|uniref:Uncharacterized protein n=1 Tax=Phytophthora megakarya TaxID=4795 RepID=A0A225UD99_9STRA|nr:hypothetical protein PHMEG_00041974 [Phytophthora megakarya]
MEGAASLGHLNVIVWLHYNRGENCSTKSMDGAAAFGHHPINIVKWLRRNHDEGCTTAVFGGAAGKGPLDMMRRLHTHRTEG